MSVKRSQQYLNVIQLPSGRWTFEDGTGWIMSAEYTSEIARYDTSFPISRDPDMVDELELEYYTNWVADTEEEAHELYLRYLLLEG